MQQPRGEKRDKDRCWGTHHLEGSGREDPARRGEGPAKELRGSVLTEENQEGAVTGGGPLISFTRYLQVDKDKN